MLFDYLFRALSGILVGIYLARFLGPGLSGLFTYFSSMAGIFAAVAKLGLDGVMVREMVQRPDSFAEDMGTAFWMMAVAGAGCLGLLVLTVSFREAEGRLVLYALAAGSVIVLQAFTVVDWFFQAKVQIRYVVGCRALNILISSILKVAAILSHAGIGTFFWICVLEQLLLAGIYMATWLFKRLPWFPARFSWQRGKALLAASWPLVFATVALSLYTRMDQVMIRIMLGDHQAGIYAAAIRIYEAWIALPTLLTLSLLPAIIQSKLANNELYKKRMVYLMRFLFFASLAVAVLTIFAARNLIGATYGSAFRQTGEVLPIIMFGGAWSALGSCTMRYLIVEHMEKKIAFRCIAGAMINALLNYTLIPRTGIQGPAIALVLSAFATNYLLDWLDPDLRPLLKLKHQAMFFLRANPNELIR